MVWIVATLMWLGVVNNQSEVTEQIIEEHKTEVNDALCEHREEIGVVVMQIEELN